MFGRCFVGLGRQAVVEVAAAAAAGAMRRWAAERQGSEKPAVEASGAQRATFTHKKQPKLTFQHVAHLEK